MGFRIDWNWKIALLLAAGVVAPAASAAVEGHVIDSGAAQEIAKDALQASLTDGDPLFASWLELSVLHPQIVSDFLGVPSYWMAPIVSRDLTVGFVRVMPDGAVSAIGMTCRTPQTPELCPKSVIAMSVDEIDTLFAREVTLQPGETRTSPRLVHDGPPGREAWLVETLRDDHAERWVFIGPGGSYQRTAGTQIGTDPEVE